jgi:hypothetical protein
MQPLPSGNLRSNICTWAVPCARVPAVAYCLPHLAPTESFDPTFRGQALETTYFDTPGLDLRRARHQGDRYLTLRLRCYRTPGGEEVYALSAKTESQKWRREIAAEDAAAISQALHVIGPEVFLPADLLARLRELAGEQGYHLVPAARVSCRRYAVENDQDRFTLDVGVRTDTGKCLPFAVLEYKCADGSASIPGMLLSLPIRPLKLSKFLWATEV